MNLLMILIVLFAILVSVCIVYIAWDLSSGKPLTRRPPREPKETKDLSDS